MLTDGAFAASAAGILVVFMLVGLRSSGRVRSAGDYAVAGRGFGALGVMSVITGVVMSGGATIGTAQMAYSRGVSGWLFTFMSAVGCIVLGTCFARPLRRAAASSASSGGITLSGFLGEHFGIGMKMISAVCSVIGSLMTLTAQFIAGRALIMTAADVSDVSATVIFVVVILSFIILGGLKSLRSVSALKTILVAVLLAASCAAAVLRLGRGVPTIISSLPFDPWLNFAPHGIFTLIATVISVISGVVCSQIYIQAIFSARDEESAVRGCLFSSAAIAPLGFMCVWIGMAMRSAGIETESSQALSAFMTMMFPSAVSGVFWGVLSIVIVGGAAGICLGIAANISFDIGPYAIGLFDRLTGRSTLESYRKHALAVNRLSVLLVIAAASVMSLSIRGSLIVELSVVSLGMRGIFFIVPLLCAVFVPGRLSSVGAVSSSLLSFAVMLISLMFVPGSAVMLAAALASTLTAAFFMLRH